MECSSKAHELSLGQLHTVVRWQKLHGEPRKMKEVGLLLLPSYCEASILYHQALGLFVLSRFTIVQRQWSP